MIEILETYRSQASQQVTLEQFKRLMKSKTILEKNPIYIELSGVTVNIIGCVDDTGDEKKDTLLIKKFEIKFESPKNLPSGWAPPEKIFDRIANAVQSIQKFLEKRIGLGN